MTNEINQNQSPTRGIWITGIIAAVVILILSLVFVSKYKKEQHKQLAIIENQKVSYTKMISSRDSIVNESMATFSQIESELNELKVKGNLLTVKSSNNDVTPNVKQQILNDIASISVLLTANKNKISSLASQLKKDGIEIVGLQAKIAELQTSIKQQESSIAELKNTLSQKDAKIAELNNKVNKQDSTLLQANQKITTQINELNKAYVICGTDKDLITKGVITKEGGFLGLGKKEVLHFIDKLYTRIDVINYKSIVVNSKSVKFVTYHPVGSYQFIKNLNDVVTAINITDPALFWKASKYAVVEVK